MGHGACWQVGMLALLAGLAGCASHGHASRQQGGAPSAGAELPAVARGSVESSIRKMPSLPLKDGAPVSEPPPSHAYRALTPAQCQCLAANASINAELQQTEAGMLPQRGLLTALRPRARA